MNASVSLEKSTFFNIYKTDFEESFIPIPSTETAHIQVLTPEASARIWKPDEVGQALLVWRRDHSSFGKQADVSFQRAVASAKQNNEMPRVILRRFEQINHSLYPVQLFLNCEIVYDFQVDAAEKLIDYVAANDVYYTKSYIRVKEWLQQLPLEAAEQVYVARTPQETFLVTWQNFVHHWDGFYSDNFCTLNVINDDPSWFLFFHAEGFAVWGCTPEFAMRKGLSRDNFAGEPISYHDELEKAHHEAQAFRELIIREQQHPVLSLKEALQ